MEDSRLDTKRDVHGVPARFSTSEPCSRSVNVLCVLWSFVLYHVGKADPKSFGGMLRTLGDVEVIPWVAVEGC